MVEILNVIKDRTKYRIRLQSNRLPFYRSDKIASFLKYVEEHPGKITKEIYDVTYDGDTVKTFDLDLSTDLETYEYIQENFRSLLERYDKNLIFIPYRVR